MKSIFGNPRGDFIRPLHRHAPRADEKILQHQRFDLAVILETVGIKVDKGSRASAMKRENGEGGACHRIGDAHPVRQSLRKRRLANAQIAMECEGSVGRKCSR